MLMAACIASARVRAQDAGPWVRFGNDKTEHVGYRDLRGVTRIPAQPIRSIADTFLNIIAVEDAATFQGYYLLKTGRRVAPDSLYYFDNTPDCESEGTIRFHDRRTDRVGFLDSTGKVTIPAVYNTVSRFHNGFAVAYRNGRKDCAGPDCEHWSWVGGESLLINRQNEVLATGLNLDRQSINWYAVLLNVPTPDTAHYITIHGSNGASYSFPDYEREFRTWLDSTLLPALASGQSALPDLLFETMTFWDKDSEWKSVSRAAFLKRFPQTGLRERLSKDRLQHSAVFDEELNGFIYTAPVFRPYFNSCGEAFSERYPAFSVVVTRPPRIRKPQA